LAKASRKQPARPKVYHITHLRNLAQIASGGWLYSDAKRLDLKLKCDVVGLSGIKQRRLKEIAVSCHPGTTVGQYVPFYFCPRSIMLYILHRGNHPELNYTGGQRPILHLQADLHSTIRWADKNGIRWAFSDRNAGTRLADFFNDPRDLGKVNWDAVQATDFRDMVVKEGKQAEFLLFEAFPWTLVEKVGVVDSATQNKVKRVLAEHAPPVEIEPEWYY
jgi:ssDNA thymidine ADP-ribosyltransferase, DarT